MKKLIQLFVIIFTILFAFSIYGQNFIKVTKSNSGQTIRLTTDQVLEISLPCTPSSGYGWYEASSSINRNIETIVQSGDWEFVPYSNDIGLVGQPGDQIIRYLGISQGTTNLNLEYKRPWEKDKPAIDEYTVTIESEGKYTGSYTPPIKLQATPIHNTPTFSSALPSSFSWKSQCTPIKDQGQCGSCWTFAGTGSFEADIKIVDGNIRNLSEQYLINCDGNPNNGCQGGYCPDAYWVSLGCVYENDCPYIDYACETTSTTATCINTCGTYPHHETASSWADVTGYPSPKDSSIKRAIYNYGPVWVAIDAGSNFQAYTGGIFTTSDGTSTDHAVVLCGWVDSAGLPNGGYWILRNSWNTTWGEAGYMRIEYGISAVGSDAAYLVYKGGPQHSVAPVAHFAAIPTTSCTGVVQFTDSSTYAPTSWSWNFGDAGISTLQNPSHTYTASGTYTVSLTVNNSYGNNTMTKTNYVTINLSPTPPTTPNVSRCGPGSVTLNASGGSNSTYYWYNASDSLLSTSSSYTTPSLTTTTTYYVEDLNISSETNLSAANGATTYCGTSGNYSLLFNITNPSSANSLVITGLSACHYHETTAYTTQVYYRTTTYVGHETSSSGWTQVYNGTSTSQAKISFTNTITIPPGGVYGIYLYIASDGGFFKSGANTYSNNDMNISTGSVVCSPTAAFTSGTLYANYSIFGNVYYKVISCISSQTACQAIINTPPSATATSNSPVCTGSTLSLTGNPGSMSSYLWSGPSSYSNATQSPTVSTSATSAMAGTYSLSVTDANGCTGTASTAVTVNTTPTITATTPASRCGTGTVALGASASAGTINWYAALTGGTSLGSGTSFTTPSISVSTTYYVAATIGSCTSSPRISVTATVNTPPTATASNNGPVCVGSALSLTGGPGSLTSYAWSGPSSYSSNTQNPIVSASATTAMAGTYILTVTDGNGCTGTVSTTVIVNTSPTATASNNGPVCVGSALILTGGPGSMTTYSWSGPSSYSSTAQSPTVSASATTAMTGTYTITVTNSNGCSGTASTTVSVNSSLPVSVIITPSANPACSGISVVFTATPTNGGTSPSYQWKVNGSGAGTNSPTFSYAPVNNDAVKCILTSNAACPTGNPATSNTIIMTVNNPPIATAGNNGPVCTGSTLSLTGGPSSMAIYAWSGPSSYSSPTQSPTVSANVTTAMAGTYTITVTDANGCAGTATTSVTVNTTPSITATSSASRCGTGTVTLGATASAGTINWYAALTGGTSLGTGTSFTTPSISASTTYYVDATSVSCISSPRTAVTATINTPPNSTASNNGPVCTGSTLSLTGGPSSMATYAWSGPSSYTSATQSPTVSASATSAMAGTYNLTVTDANGCTGTASTVVIVNTTTSITGQPSSPASVCAGTGTPTFTVTATGTGLTYQWQEYISSWNNLSDGSVYSGCTTASLIITNPPIGMNGYRYRCIVTSGSCSVTSDGIATLTVTSAMPVITNIVIAPTSPTPIQTVSISSDVTSPCNTINSVICKWCTDGLTFGNSITMNLGTAPTYTTSTPIPAQTGGTTVYYKIVAADNALDTTISSVQSYTVTGGEPTNYPTNFQCGTTLSDAIPLTWTDANSGIIPDAYLVKGSSVSYAAITDPVDGTPEANAALVYNVAQGTQTVTFSGLSASTTYYFKIYPYTGSGASINYKTSPAAPQTSCATIASPTIVTWNFPNNPDDNKSDGGIIANYNPPTTYQTITNNASGATVYNVTGNTTQAAQNTGWNAGSGTKYWQVNFITTLYDHLKVSSKQYSGNSAGNRGPRDFKIQYSTDGITFNDVIAVPQINNNWTSGVVTNVSLVSACNDQSSLYLRWIMTSNTSTNNGTIGNTAVSRIDDVIVTGDPILPDDAGTITGTTPICQGTNSVSFSVPAIANATGYNWLYSGTGATINGSGTNITINFSSTATSGNVIVYGTNSNGDGLPSSFAVTINPSPTASATNNGPICTGSTLALTGEPLSMASYNWSGPNLYSSTVQSPTVSASATSAMAGTYTITVTDANGCAGTATTSVTVNTTPSITATSPA
ncbi:MAG: C1 family peptidase, partial [Bacteroidales bacterium]